MKKSKKNTKKNNNNEARIKFYVLSEVIEREISNPQIFYSYEKAVKELEERINSALGYQVDKHISIHDKDIWDELDDCGCVIYEDKSCSVWGENMNHDNIDWTITPQTMKINFSLSDC